MDVAPPDDQRYRVLTRRVKCLTSAATWTMDKGHDGCPTTPRGLQSVRPDREAAVGPAYSS